MESYHVIPAEVLCVFPVISSVIWVTPFFFVCFEVWSTSADVFNSSLVKDVVPAVVGARRIKKMALLKEHNYRQYHSSFLKYGLFKMPLHSPLIHVCPSEQASTVAAHLQRPRVASQ